MRVTIRHHYDFGADRQLVGEDLVRPAAWDALRIETHGAFAIAASPEELEQAATANEDIAARARAVDGVLEGVEANTVASYGVGGALLEWWLQRIRPQRRLILADYAPRTVERLQELFVGTEVRRHDLLADPPLEADAHLFHRIDTELTNDEWHHTFRRFADDLVVVVATEVAGTRRLVQELLLRIRNPHATRAGWLRTRGAFDALWRETHEARLVRMYDLDAWVLAPRRS